MRMLFIIKMRTYNYNAYVILLLQHFQETFVIDRVRKYNDEPEDAVTFEMKNIVTPLANAIRRIMIAEVLSMLDVCVGMLRALTGLVTGPTDGLHIHNTAF